MWFKKKKDPVLTELEKIHQQISHLDIRMQSFDARITGELRGIGAEIVKAQGKLDDQERLLKYAGIRLDVITLGEAYLLAKQEDRKIWDKARVLLEEMGFRAEKISERKPRQFTSQSR